MISQPPPHPSRDDLRAPQLVPVSLPMRVFVCGVPVMRVCTVLVCAWVRMRVNERASTGNAFSLHICTSEAHASSAARDTARVGAVQLSQQPSLLLAGDGRGTQQVRIRGRHYPSTQAGWSRAAWSLLGVHGQRDASC